MWLALILSSWMMCAAPLAHPTPRDITKDELLGKFDPAKHKDFVPVAKEYTGKEGTLYLRKQAYDAFVSMAEAAKKDGVKLSILSATRNFDYQKGIWERKWARPGYKGQADAAIAKDILKYSAMPGASRHHWGTDVDFNSVDPAYFKAGAGKKIYDWLCAHGSEYGFCQTYTEKTDGRKGYEEEKWHWSFVPLSQLYLTNYNKLVTYADYTGFSGSAAAKELMVIEDYVNGVSPRCK